MPPTVIAVDQGTSSTKGIVLDAAGHIVGAVEQPVSATSSQPGWMEQDAVEILDSVKSVLRTLNQRVDEPVAAIGLSTQRESALAWDTATGAPLSPVIGWQDVRAGAVTDRFSARDAAAVRDISGLPLSPMFSAAKFAWILDAIDPARSRSRRGEITLGTVDAWLLRGLCGVRQAEHGNASRTQLMDLRTGSWSRQLLDAFAIPAAALPDIVASDASTQVFDASIGSAPVSAVLGDSHAALFAHGNRVPGAVKVTYGTGSSVMGLSSSTTAVAGLASTVAWRIHGRVAHAFEGNIFSAGATIVWLARLLETTPAALAVIAEQAPEAAETTSPGPRPGVDFVPAFSGLGAPWWDRWASGTLTGLSFNTDRAQIARAAFEAITLQVEDVLGAATSASGDAGITRIHVDGGPSANDWLMQMQADVSDRIVVRPKTRTLSACGAAWLAGATAGLWDVDARPWEEDVTVFRPTLPADRRAERMARWRDAVRRSRPEPDLHARTSTSNDPVGRAPGRGDLAQRGTVPRSDSGEQQREESVKTHG